MAEGRGWRPVSQERPSCQLGMYNLGDQGFLPQCSINAPHRSMSSFMTRRIATICALIVFSLLTLSFFRFPSGPSQLYNVASTAEVAPNPFSNNAPPHESLVDLFGAESNLIGLPTQQFRGPSRHLISPTFGLTAQLQIICEATVNTSRPGYQLVGVRRSLYPLFLADHTSSQQCHDLCEPTSHSIALSLTCADR